MDKKINRQLDVDLFESFSYAEVNSFYIIVAPRRVHPESVEFHRCPEPIQMQ